MSTVDTRLKELGIEPLYDNYQPLQESEIAEIESGTTKSLPADYKAFVSRLGVSHFEGCVYLPVSDASEFAGFKSIELDVFLGGGSVYDIRSSLLSLSDRIGPGIIPIAEGSGNVFLMDLSNNGKILFWSTQHETLADVAESFTDFVLRLERKHVEPEEDQIGPPELLVQLPMHAISNLGEESDDQFEVLYELLDQSLQSHRVGSGAGGDYNDEKLTILIQSSDKEAAYELVLANLRSRELLNVANVAYFDDREEAYGIVWPSSARGTHINT